MVRKLESVLGKKYGSIFVKLVDNIMRKQPDTCIDYWKRAANKDDMKTMKCIAYGLDKHDFENVPVGIVEILEDYDLRSKRIMDLACGIGRTCRWIAPKSKEYVGVDYVPKMIEKAKIYNRQFKNANFYVNDGETLSDFTDDSFDIVYCEWAMQHMHKHVQESYVKDVFRILKPGGIFLAQVPRIEFFEDEKISRTEKDTKQLFSQYDIEDMHIIHHYYTTGGGGERRTTN